MADLKKIIFATEKLIVVRCNEGCCCILMLQFEVLSPELYWLTEGPGYDFTATTFSQYIHRHQEHIYHKHMNDIKAT